MWFCCIHIFNCIGFYEFQIQPNADTLLHSKSGGHASNPGFSSTSGVQISLVRLKQVVLSADKKTVNIGLGNVCSSNNTQS